MKSGLGNEHRRGLWLREELNLPPTATDMAVAEALLIRTQRLENKLTLLEKVLETRDDQ